MFQSSAPRVARHRQQLRDHFTEQPRLTFGDLLTEQRFHEIVAEEEVRGRQCFFTPLMTVWGWLWQTLRSGSCWEAALACMTWAMIAQRIVAQSVVFTWLAVGRVDSGKAQTLQCQAYAGASEFGAA